MLPLRSQHRKLAADQRTDIRELPCLVFETTSRREEAVSFLAINQGRIGVGSLDRYRAQLMSGDTTASAVESMLRRVASPKLVPPEDRLAIGGGMV